MLLRNRLTTPESWLRLGVPMMIVSLIGLIAVHPEIDFLRGFSAGFFGSLLGLSAVLNVRGLYLVGRRTRAGESG